MNSQQLSFYASIQMRIRLDLLGHYTRFITMTKQTCLYIFKSHIFQHYPRLNVKDIQMLIKWIETLSRS